MSSCINSSQSHGVQECRNNSHESSRSKCWFLISAHNCRLTQSQYAVTLLHSDWKLLLPIVANISFEWDNNILNRNERTPTISLCIHKGRLCEYPMVIGQHRSWTKGRKQIPTRPLQFDVENNSWCPRKKLFIERYRLACYECRSIAQFVCQSFLEVWENTNLIINEVPSAKYL